MKELLKVIVTACGCLGLWTIYTVHSADPTRKDVAALQPVPPNLEGMATSNRRFMNTLFFFDDWHFRAREGLDRKLGRPQMLREVLLDFQSDPDLKSIRGLVPKYDPIKGCYTLDIDCHDQQDRRFFIRLESPDPYTWPAVRWRPGDGPLWTRVDNVYLDQHDNRLCCFNILPLIDTPLADKGYFINLVDHGNATGFSQDGFLYELDANAPWVRGYGSDTGNPTLYNPWTGRFMIFCRPDCLDRRVARIDSPDLKTFSQPTVIFQPDPQDPVGREFYGLAAFLYGDVFLGMLAVYDTEPTENRRFKMQGTSQPHLAYSYNGQNWYRASRDPFMPRSAPGTHAGGSVYAGLVRRTPDNRLLFGGMVTWTEHGMDIGHSPEEWRTKPYRVYMYDMRLDGFVYLRTRARQGMVRTKTVVPQGGEMTINVRTSPSGHVRVAVLNEAAEPIPGYSLADSIPLTGDHLFGKVSWRNGKNLDDLKGKPVLIEITIREGELYALRFTHQVAPGEHIRDRQSMMYPR